jgi:hypothetical protein
MGRHMNKVKKSGPVEQQPAKKSAHHHNRLYRWTLTGTVIFYLAKSSGGGGKKKLSVFNRYMKAEMSRLKVSHPQITHQERCVLWCLSGICALPLMLSSTHSDRFKLATTNWKTAKENPKSDS